MALISAAVWIAAAIRHKPTGAKTGVLVGVILAAVSLFMFARSYDPSLRQDHQQEEPPTASTPAQGAQEEPTMEPVSTPEAGGQETTKPEPTAQETPTEEPEQYPVNPLVLIPVQTRPVMNGTQTERIGTWAYIETTKAAMQEVTGRQLQLYLLGMNAEDYKWFNVFFEDGTGLYCMTGMDGYYVEYGAVDREEGGAVTSAGGVEIRYFNFDAETETYAEE